MKLEVLNDVSPLTTDSLVSEAQLMFNEVTFTHLPVVDGFEYLGAVAEFDIRSLDGDKLIKDYVDIFDHFFVKEEGNELEIIENASKYHTNLIPVLSENDNRYIGYIDLIDVVHAFGDAPFLSEHGNVLVVQKGLNDYSFSEICQIVESNNTKVLGVYISSMEKDVVEATVKIGDGDFNAIIQTFRRYGYEIMSDHYDDVLLNNLKDRSRYFTKYLNI